MPTTPNTGAAQAGTPSLGAAIGATHRVLAATRGVLAVELVAELDAVARFLTELEDLEVAAHLARIGVNHDLVDPATRDRACEACFGTGSTPNVPVHVACTACAGSGEARNVAPTSWTRLGLTQRQWENPGA